MGTAANVRSAPAVGPSAADRTSGSAAPLALQQLQLGPSDAYPRSSGEGTILHFGNATTIRSNRDELHVCAQPRHWLVLIWRDFGHIVRGVRRREYLGKMHTSSIS
jgi:hypothetical protein